ncbi:MAG: nucleotidyltransferase domain-containing protein [Victivallaceae bacterium]|nr:nucleotidyltransferase domain-containing protein [Victivallaceae bacterium]
MIQDEAFSFDSLSKSDSPRVIFRGIWGSHAYGTSTPESDRDTVGVFVVEPERYLAICNPVSQVADDRNDNRFYSLKNYLELAASANPNILDSLFLPDDCVVRTTECWRMLQDRRNIFVSRQASRTYCEYAMAQIKKARGCNKRVHNPRPKEPPAPEEFCRVLPVDSPGMPGRPVPLADAGIDLARCHVAAVESSSDMYRR